MDGGGEGTVFGWWIDQMVDVVHGEVTRMHEAPFGVDFDFGSLFRSFSSLELIVATKMNSRLHRLHCICWQVAHHRARHVKYVTL